MKFFHMVAMATFSMSLTACDKKENIEATGQDQTLAKSAARGNVLAFSIPAVSSSNLFENGIRVTQVDAIVDGGTKNDWIATGIAIAEKAIEVGANSAKVTILGPDLGNVPRKYREYAVVYYGPDLNKTIWPDEKWSIFSADRLVTKSEISAAAEFEMLNGKYIAQGMDAIGADKKAGQEVARKYSLAEDWSLPLGNLGGDKIDRASVIINAAPTSTTSIDILDRCLRGSGNMPERRCT
ncbi:hypothetical protein [Janthinobacterium sp. SUN033]|uniref:hypothetical protein n=1 Tax=Janthinobacterium sp. SUN033 TaxID=3002439 RepID=UPI0025AF3D5C|nr:hypothetical protein [Janthinobacterium sp. SUN033]MDN2676749.1 hypothetical protein [Janthinobacterium sp. SUN033]